MADVLIAAAAEQDYTEALCWYAQRSKRAANGFESEFEQAIRAIQATPQRFPFCDASHRFYLMRRYPFLVIFRETSGRLLIVAVAHAKRQPGYWQGR
jgi:plasmid stabilization system protein ParE